MDSIKLLHEWTITVEQTVNETTTEDVNGSKATVTREVKKPISTKMGLRRPTRREFAAADLFYGKQCNDFLKMGFLPRSILVNKHLDMSGGILSQKEKGEVEQMLKKHDVLVEDLKLTTDQQTKDTINKQLGEIRDKVITINEANEAIFSQTAEAKARSQQKTWFGLFMIVVERGGRWVPYFEGDTFEQKEEYMWQLEEKADPFYDKAMSKIALFVDFFFRGATTPEQFAAFDTELKRQEDERTKKTEEQKAETSAVPEVVAAT